MKLLLAIVFGHLTAQLFGLIDTYLFSKGFWPDWTCQGLTLEFGKPPSIQKTELFTVGGMLRTMPALLVAMWVFLRLRRRELLIRLQTSLCQECSYSLAGLTSGRCPECGTTFDSRTISRHEVVSDTPSD